MSQKKKKKLPKLMYANGGDIIYGTNVPTTFTNVSNVSDDVANIANTPYYTSSEDLAKMNKVGYKPESTVVYHQDPNNPRSVILDNYSKVAQAEAAMDKLITPSGVAKVKKPFGGFINQGVTNIAKGLGVNDKTANVIGSGVATATGFIPGMQDNLFQAGDLAGDIMNTSGNRGVRNAGQNVSALSPLLNMIPLQPQAAPQVMAGGGNLNFKSKGAYKKWLGYVYANNLNKPGGASVSIDGNPHKVQRAMGGQLTEYTGNDHSEGGIPLGDTNVEVEGNETRAKDYIYSDRIKTPWNKKITFADESKRINSKYKGREEDPLAQKSLEIELNKLKDMQETVKQKMVEKAGKIMQQAGMHQMPDGSQMMNSQMAYGGKMYYAQGGYGVPTFEESAPFFTQEESKNYAPQEVVLTQYLTNQLNSGKINKAQFDEALAEMGQGSMGSVRQDDGSIKSYWEDKYPQAFGNTGTEGQSSAANLVKQNPDAGQGMGQKNTATSPDAGGTSNNAFNDELTTGQKLMPYLPMLGQAATLIGGATKTDYSEMTPQYINLKNQRTAAEKQAAIARLTTNRNIRNTAGNSGRALSNMVTSGAAIQSNLGDQLGQSYMTEANTNAQIGNQANQFNTQIRNEEINANEMNKSRFQEQAIATLANVANTYSGVGRDQRAFASQNMYNNIAAQNLGTENYVIGYTADGTPITKFRPSNI